MASDTHHVQTKLRHVLHKYANEDVSMGAWFIGLDVDHIDDRRLCCGTPPGKLNFNSIVFFITLFSMDYKNIVILLGQWTL